MTTGSNVTLPPSSGIVSHWKLDESSGTTATDVTGSHDGTLVNGPIWHPAGGKIGGSLEFDGLSDQIQVPSSTDFDTDGTWSLWVKTDGSWGSSTRVAIMSRADGSASRSGIHIVANRAVDGGAIDVHIMNFEQWHNTCDITGTVDITDNAWHQITLTFQRANGAVNSLYIDGVLDSTCTNGYAWDFNNQDIVWGWSWDASSWNAFLGQMDDIYIYNRVLSASEVMDLYRAGTNLSHSSGPVAYWKLDETSGNTVADSAGSYTGTWQYSATNDPVPGVIGNAMHTGWARYIDVGGPITEINGASQASLSVWMRRSAAGQQERIGQGIGYESREFGIAYEGSNVVFTIPDTVVDGTWAQGSYALNDTNWHLLTLVFDGTQTGDANRLKGYVDGAAVSLTLTGTIGSTINASIYGFILGDDQLTDVVDIDDVRVYNRALSATEVQNLYNTGVREVLDNPIAWWKLDESTGTTAADSSGNGNTGTLTNGPVWQPTSGKSSGALSFDGVDDEVDTGTIPGLAADSGNPFTFAFWYKAAPGANTDLFGWSAFRYCTTGYAGDLMTCTINSSSLFVTSTTNVSDNNWHHIAYTVTNAVQYLYVDGNVEDSASDTIETSDPTAGIIIGGRDFGGHIQAQFDDVRIYDKALSAAEVAALYSLTACHGPAGDAGTIIFNTDRSVLQYCNGSEWVAVGASSTAGYMSGLVGQWLLDDGSGTTATDSAGSNDGTLTNGPVWLPSGGHDGGGAVQFDGTNDYIGGTLPGYDWQATGLTLSLWVKDWPSTDQDDVIIELWDSSDTGRRLRISTDNFAPLQRYQIQAGRQFSAREVEIHHPGSTAITNISAWKHLVVTLSPTAGIFYLDGVAVASDTAVTPFGTVNLDSFRIGGGTTDYNGAAVATYESGTVDDVRVWDRALSATEVADLYNASGPAMPTPIAEWKMDEGSGTTTADSIGSNDGTLTNGPTWGTGLFGGAVQFDGTDDLVSISSGSVPVLTDSAGTISAWIKADSSDIGQDNYWPIFREYYHDNHNNGGGIGFFLYQGGPSDPMTVGSTFGDTSNNFQNIFSSSPFILAGQWYHVAVSWTASTATLFVDGSEVDSEARTVPMGTSSSNGSDNINIGYNNGTNGGGLIDDVRIYDTALTAAQIRSLYQATACTDPTGAPGTMIYNNTHSVLQYCNGTNWVGIGK